MANLVHTKSTAYVAVGVASAQASAQFATTMQDGQIYILSSTTGAWVAIDSNPTAATRTAGSFYLPPNIPTPVICQGSGNKVAVIQDAAAGHASLTASM